MASVANLGGRVAAEARGLLLCGQQRKRPPTEAASFRHRDAKFFDRAGA
jgi:hypothetical protein